MSRYINPSGYVKYDTEEELCKELEENFFDTFFDGYHQYFSWKPILEKTKEVWIDETNRIDYMGLTINYGITYVEIKNWFVTKKDMNQIMTYYEIIKPYKLFVICGGIENYRRTILELCNIGIILVKNIKEINPEEVIYWM